MSGALVAAASGAGIAACGGSSGGSSHPSAAQSVTGSTQAACNKLAAIETGPGIFGNATGQYQVRKAAGTSQFGTDFNNWIAAQGGGNTEQKVIADCKPWFTDVTSPGQSKSAPSPPASSPAPAPTTPQQTTPPLTTSQQSAIQDAKSYLQSVGGFSKKGLVEQVESDQFSSADAWFAVDHISVNWDAQAAQDAKSYMQSVGGFSYGGMVQQLESDGFTPAQAAYGAKSVGL